MSRFILVIFQILGFTEIIAICMNYSSMEDPLLSIDMDIEGGCPQDSVSNLQPL